MTTQAILSEPLAGLCRRLCGRCAPEGADAAGRAPVLIDEPHYEPFEAAPKRRFTLSLPRCERCQFLLLMQAIEHLIPAPDQADWLRLPNADLDGLSPAECIDAGRYEPVFMALFFLDPCGPVS